jgi:hypothetical protein
MSTGLIIGIIVFIVIIVTLILVYFLVIKKRRHPPTPGGCTSNAQCTPPLICNTLSGQCIMPIPTGCTSNAQCIPPQICNLSTGQCVSPTPSSSIDGNWNAIGGPQFILTYNLANGTGSYTNMAGQRQTFTYVRNADGTWTVTYPSGITDIGTVTGKVLNFSSGGVWYQGLASVTPADGSWIGQNNTTIVLKYGKGLYSPVPTGLSGLFDYTVNGSMYNIVYNDSIAPTTATLSTNLNTLTLANGQVWVRSGTGSLPTAIDGTWTQSGTTNVIMVLAGGTGTLTLSLGQTQSVTYVRNVDGTWSFNFNGGTGVIGTLSGNTLTFTGAGGTSWTRP